MAYSAARVGNILLLVREGCDVAAVLRVGRVVRLDLPHPGGVALGYYLHVWGEHGGRILWPRTRPRVCGTWLLGVGQGVERVGVLR